MLKSMFGGCYSALFDQGKTLYKKLSNHVDPEESKSQISNDIDRLETKNREYEEKCDQLTKEARIHVKKKNRKKAMMCLKRKKLIQKSIQINASKITNLEQLDMKIEEAKFNKSHFETNKSFLSTLSTINGGLKVDDILDTVDDIKDAIDDQEEITNALSTPLGQEVDIDEGELEDELAELEDEVNMDALGELDVPNEKKKVTFVLEEEVKIPKKKLTYKAKKKVRLRDLDLDKVGDEDALKKILQIE